MGVTDVFFRVKISALNTNYPPFWNVTGTIATTATQFCCTVSDFPKAVLYKALSFILLTNKHCAKCNDQYFNLSYEYRDLRAIKR